MALVKLTMPQKQFVIIIISILIVTTSNFQFIASSKTNSLSRLQLLLVI